MDHWSPEDQLGGVHRDHRVLRGGAEECRAQDDLLGPAAEGRSVCAGVQGSPELRQPADRHPDGQEEERRHLQCRDPEQGLADDARHRPGAGRRPRPDPVDRDREGALCRGDALRYRHAAADG